MFARPATLQRLFLICFLLGDASGANAFQDHSGEHKPLTLDVRLKLIVSAGRERFRPIMTYRVDMVPSGSSWYEVNNSVPGASFCRVYEHPQVIYTCEWTRGPKAPIFSALAKEIEEALEKRWKRTDQSGRRKIARFAPVNGESRDGIIQLEETATSLKLVIQASSQER